MQKERSFKRSIQILSLVTALLWIFLAANGSVGAALDAGRANGLEIKVPTARANAAPIPHPILSDVLVRRAIAHCTDRDALIASVYPLLTPAERQALIMETFVLQTSWAYSPPAMTYAYDPIQGQALLATAGWVLPNGAEYRSKDGNELRLQLNTTDTVPKQIWLPVFEQQMKACGIHVVRNHTSPGWLLGALTGLQVRDFELAEFAWVLGDDPGGVELYACDQIPTPTNAWTGQNYMGWCNSDASDAITWASNTALSQAERKPYYATFLNLFAENLPSLPLFLRHGGTILEHLDFNLETFAQVAQLTPAGVPAPGLAFSDYQGKPYTVTAPAGAVADSVMLQFYPLVGNANPPSNDKFVTNAFRLTAVIGGVPQPDFAFNEPITLTVHYDLDEFVYHVSEASLVLFAWDSGSSTWVDASETCPVDQRFKHLDMDANLYVVKICHLSEFSLFGSGGEGIRMGVNYGFNEAAGMYEVGHSFMVSVKDGSDALKAVAVAVTEAGGPGQGAGCDFAWSDGFWIEQDEWSDPALDIVPGDKVYFVADDGFTEMVQVGGITAHFNLQANTVEGMVTAPWLPMPPDGFGGWWGWFWEEFVVETGGHFFADFSPFDLQAGQRVTVGYEEQDLDKVINVFTSMHEVYLPLARK